MSRTTAMSNIRLVSHMRLMGFLGLRGSHRGPAAEHDGSKSTAPASWADEPAAPGLPSPAADLAAPWPPAGDLAAPRLPEPAGDLAAPGLPEPAGDLAAPGRRPVGRHARRHS